MSSHPLINVPFHGLVNDVRLQAHFMNIIASHVLHACVGRLDVAKCTHLRHMSVPPRTRATECAACGYYAARSRRTSPTAPAVGRPAVRVCRVIEGR